MRTLLHARAHVKAVRLAMATVVVAGLAVLPVLATQTVASAAPIISSCTLGYTDTSNSPRSGVAFSESEVLRAFSAAADGSTVQLFYNDEHALSLGVRQVITKNSAGTVTSTTNYPVTAMPSNPGSATNPDTGATALQGGIDASNRPISPSLFVTDLTVNGATSRAGDWQQGVNPPVEIRPDFVSGSWKSIVVTLQTGKTPVSTVDADPAKNNWSLGAGADPVPLSGNPPVLPKNEGYGAEARWNTASIPGGITAGHQYRFQFMDHDGDQNKTGGDSGEACINIQFPGPPTVVTDTSGGQGLAKISTAIGTTINDIATWSGNAGTVTGTNTFHLYFVPVAQLPVANPCVAAYEVTTLTNPTKTLASGVATSDNYTPNTNDGTLALGTFFWQSHYTPDASAHYLAADEQCGNETVTVVDARLKLTPHEATNVVGTPHTLTATLESTTDNLTFTAVPNAIVNFTFVTPPAVSAVFVAPSNGIGNPCTTNSSGTCQVKINDSVAEDVVVHAASNFTIQNVLGSFSKSTSAGCASDTCDAIKHYISPKTQLTVSDSLTGLTGNTAGTVTYTVFHSESDCSGNTSGTVLNTTASFSGAVAPGSTSVTVGPGSVFGNEAWFIASYTGNLGSFTSPCTERASST